MCQETRLSSAPIIELYVVVELRQLLRCLSATPEGVLNLAKEASSTRTTVIRFLHGVVSQLFCADGRKMWNVTCFDKL